MTNHPDFDTEAVLAEARALLPMDRLLGQYGAGPTKDGETLKSFTCPFCKKPKRAGIFPAKDGKAMLFKCHGKTCAGNQVCNEVGLVGRLDGINGKEAFKAYLKMAGVKDRRPARVSNRAPDAVVDAQADAEAAGEPPSEVDAVASLAEAEPGDEVSNTLPDGEIVPRGTIEDRLAAAQGPRGLARAASKALTKALFTAPAPEVEVPDLPNIPVPLKPAPEVGGVKGLEAQLAAEADAEAVAIAKKIVAMADGHRKPAKKQSPRRAPELRVMPRPTQLSESEGRAQAALRDFYGRLTLSAADARMLGAKRGLTGATVAALGYKSNPLSNLALLLGLERRHSRPALEMSGLWGYNNRGDFAPKAQFHGWGISGKQEDGEAAWSNCLPILIPYCNAAGELVQLRPHKGGPESSDACRARCYVARPVGQPDDRKYRRVLVAESEFKAAAVWQIVGPGANGGAGVAEWECYGACALPGIAMSRRAEVMEDLEQFLRGAGANGEPVQVVVCFDNEEKGDPTLPGYKEQRSKRFDTPLYAAYLARVLRAGGFEAEVAWLPDAFRVNGKADWDGVLAEMVSAGTMDVKGYAVTA